MKILRIQKDVMSGGCHAALLRLQIRHTAIFFFCNLANGWNGSQIGLFTPKKINDKYRCLGFEFSPWLAPDLPYCKLPRWYTRTMKAISFRFD